MGKGRKIIGLGLLLSMLCGGLAFAEPGAEGEMPQSMSLEDECRIEQVYLNLPEVFVYGDGFSLEDVESAQGYLSQDKLELVQAQPFFQQGEGITYYVLLDISGSIPRTYFSSIKEGIQNLQNGLGASDQLILCTFGEEVALAADGSQTAQELEAILAGLSNRDQETLLFEGIDRVAAMTEQTRGVCRRQVLLVVSDGEDFAVGKKMAQEALATLKDKGLPAYALCIQDTDKVNINSFGEFARTSGGQLITFPASEGASVLTKLAGDLSQDICIEYRAANNIVSNKEENFSLQFADGRVLSRAVMNVHWIPDNEPPYLLSGEAVGKQQIRLVFSEPMSGLAGAANYAVTFNGHEVGVTGVAYDKEDETKITLTLAEPVENGTYKVMGANLTDASMEKNPLEGGSLVVEISGVEPPKPEPPQPVEDGPNYMGIIFLLIVGIGILIIVLIVISKKKKDKALEEGDGSAAGNTNTVAMKDEGFQNQYKIIPGQKRPLDVVIAATGKQAQMVKWELGSSLIIGRAETCDITVADNRMSRQHFCLESEKEGIFISDLGSTNGTAVNGIRLGGKRLLQPGDRVEAGSMSFTIRW